MNTFEENLNYETVNSAMEKINYYLHLPAHIKGTVTALDNVNLNNYVNYASEIPAHVIDGSITAINGRINIPDINKISKLYEVEQPTLLLFN